jgi:hypothetical protein
MKLPAPHINALGRSGVVLCAIRLCVLAVLIGCSSKPPVSETIVVQRIGSFVGQTGTIVDETFSIPFEYETICLGLSFFDSARGASGAGRLLMAKEIASLRLALSVYDGKDARPLWTGDVALDTNCTYFPFWNPDFGVLFTELSLFPYPTQILRQPSPGGGESIEWNARSGEKLKVRETYRMQLRVLNPTSATNRISLWLYTRSTLKRGGNGDEMRQIE